MSNSNDNYYQHVLTNRSYFKSENDNVITYYLSSKKRDISKYPNKFNFSINLEDSFSDVYMVEITRLYFNYKNIDSNGPDFLVLNIEELNNKYSNNDTLNKGFIEIPINNFEPIIFDTNNTYAIRYFNPPLVKLNKFRIQINNSEGKQLNDNMGEDYLIVFNIKQLSKSSVIKPN